MSKSGERELLLLKLATLREERDLWEGRSQRNFELAAALVGAVEKRLRLLDTEVNTPLPPARTRAREQTTIE